ncbi:hypothetical protein VTO42DRAFT_2407 [Malbranchea cinnamomea]
MATSRVTLYIYQGPVSNDTKASRHAALFVRYDPGPKGRLFTPRSRPCRPAEREILTVTAQERSEHIDEMVGCSAQLNAITRMRSHKDFSLSRPWSTANLAGLSCSFHDYQTVRIQLSSTHHIDTAAATHSSNSNVSIYVADEREDAA